MTPAELNRIQVLLDNSGDFKNQVELIYHVIPGLLIYVDKLETANQQLLIALQDAIRRPAGVVPDSAIPFIW